MRPYLRRVYSGSEEDQEEPPINLTPLVDVVFVVLITFMIIAPILNVDHVELAPGGVMAKSEAQNTPLSITLRADNTIYFQGKPISLQNLKSACQAQKSRFPGECPQLLADKNSHFGSYQEVKNVLEECGFQQMDIVLN